MSRPVAVVTGVTRGLGAAFASALLRRGYTVAGCSTTGAGVLGVVVHQVDVCDATAMDKFAEEIATRFGAIDVWVNNAGVLGPVGPLRDANHVEWERAVAVNLDGVVAGTHAFLSRRSDPAVLVNIASRAGVRPFPGLSVYAATKAAVISLTQSVAEEERARGLRTYAVLPPSIDTDMQDVLLRQDPRAFPGVAESRRRSDEGRIASAEVVAERVLSMVLDRTNVDVLIDLTGD
ncbi:MAG TPA: SDR family oxidoreductase [Acidimicrobiales bacterium]|nr:SDR family oxidoreductase [Acidimicrobiales bacterium]